MRFFRDVKKYKKYAVYAAKAQLNSEVKNAYFDWLWWILEPFGLMLIYAFIFGNILGAAEEYFAIFIFSSNVMWSFFSKCVISSVRLIKSNETTISKVYIPKFVLLFVEMLVNAYKMLISFGIVLAMLVVYRVQITWRVILLVPIFIIFFVLVYGICLIVMHVGVFMADMAYIVNILLNMLMYMSGIFYSFERFDASYSMFLENGNPIAFLMSSMRKVLIYASDPNYVVLLMWLVISGLLAVCGTCIIYKNENNYVKVG